MLTNQYCESVAPVRHTLRRTLHVARTFDDERADAVHGFHFAEVEHAVFDEVGAGVLVVRRQSKPDRHVDQLIAANIGRICML